MACMLFQDKDAGPEYDLYAVINHSGTMAGGHYVATCRVPGAWCFKLQQQAAEMLVVLQGG